MPDQADKLRQWIEEASPQAIAPAPSPPMVVVTGGRAGVGITTVAVNLAAVLADRGARVLLVDAVAGHSKMAQIAGLDMAQVQYTIAEVLAGKCLFAEALAPLCFGASVLVKRPGRRCENFPRRVQQKFLADLQSLEDSFDAFVIDAGSGLTAWSRRFWLQARHVLLVTTPQSAAVTDSYATIKRSIADRLGPDVRLVVNQCDDDSIGAETQRKLSHACSRFIGRPLPGLAPLPWYVDASGRHPMPRVWESPNTPFGHAVLWLGRAVKELLSIEDASYRGEGPRSYQAPACSVPHLATASRPRRPASLLQNLPAA
jgi:flagellar biosynthesis protein FlhG